MTKGKPRPEFPDRKISETFLHFAEPLLEPLGPHATEEQENQALQIAFTVWNAVVYESAIGDRRFMTTLRNSTGSQPEVAALVAYMISRKQALFGDDHRLVGEFKFVHREGERRLRVEARSPYRIDSAHPVPQPSTDSASGSNVNRAN